MHQNGSNLNKIVIRYGGKQPQDFFGPYHTPDYPLQVGDVQSMQFGPDDPGPCNMSESVCIASKYDINTGQTRKRDVTCANMIKALKEKGVKDPSKIYQDNITYQ